MSVVIRLGIRRWCILIIISTFIRVRASVSLSPDRGLDNTRRPEYDDVDGGSSRYQRIALAMGVAEGERM